MTAQLKSNVNTHLLMGGVISLTGFLLFSTKAIFVKLAYREGIDPSSLLMLRMVFALPFFVLVFMRTYYRDPKIIFIIRQHRWMMIVLGLLGYYIASFFDFYGLRYIDASLERIVIYIYPTLVVIISHLWIKTSISPMQIWAILITYIGIVIAYGGNISINPSNHVAMGTFLVLVSALTYAIYLVGSQKFTSILGTRVYNSVVMIIACFAVIGHNLWMNDTDYFAFNSKVYVYALLIATIATVIPSFMIVEGIKRLGAGNSAILGSLGPISTMIMATFLLGESISLLQWIGSFIVVGGVVMVLISKEVARSG